MRKEISGNDMQKLKRINERFNRTELKLDSKSGETLKFNIFDKDGKIAISDDTKALLSKYDSNKDGQIDMKELIEMKGHIINLAGKDKILTEEELGSPQLMSQVKTLIERFTSGKSHTEITENGVTTISDLNSDGSGTVTKKSKDKKGNDVVVTNELAPGGKVVKRTQVVTKNGETISSATTDFTYGENGKIASSKTLISTAKGESSVEKTFKYDENNNCTENTTICKDQKGAITSKEIIKREYDENNKIKEEEITSTGKIKSRTTVTKKHYEDGKIMSSEMFEKKLKNPLKMEFETTKISESKYEYHENGKLAKKTTTGTQSGKPSTITDTFDEDGKTLKTREHIYYKRGALHRDFYDGANLTNRAQGGLPTTRIIYEDDGTTVKQKIMNKFDDNGIYIGQEKYDKNDNLIESKDFSQVDGHFDTAYQIGRGDCYFLASLNALSATEEGEKLLEQNFTKNPDGSYTIKFPGAGLARNSLINGTGNVSIPTNDGKALTKLPEDKVYIQDSYTISAEEFEAAQKLAGKRYSAGDKDVLIMELAYEKYRDDVIQTIKANNIDYSKTKFIAGLDMGGHVDEGDYLSGGFGESCMFILTGTRSESYRNPNVEEVPTCYIDSDYQMHVPDADGILADMDVEKAITTSVNGVGSTNNIDDLLAKLREDSKDGKIDDYSAVANFKVSQQEVNGKVIPGGGHALTILRVTDDSVVLSNPWSPDDEVVMSIEDFKKATYHMNCMSLKPKTSQTQNTTSNTTGTTGTTGNTGATGTTGTTGTTGNNTTQATTHNNGTNTEYTVARGDTMWKIAKKHLPQGATSSQIANFVTEMIKANPHIKNPNKIFVGDKINIPKR